MSKLQEMESQKSFVCTVQGCSLKFSHEDNLSVHQMKHDMVLNLENGQKTNVFAADQTPTPTRFIRNCEEVGLFQDLQYENPFEETFRKAVENRVGSSHLEVPSLHLPVTDDTLHTPHVFPNITEDHGSISNLISPTTVPETPSGEKSQPRLELVSLQVPTIFHAEPTIITVTDTDTDLDAGIEIIELENTEVLVKQETDTSLHFPSRAPSVDSRCKIPEATASEQDTVQVVIRMPNGRLVELRGVSMDSVPSTQLPVQVAPTIVQTSKSSTASSAVVINTQLVESPLRQSQISTAVQQNVDVSSPGISLVSTSTTNASTATTPQARLSAAKMKLKQRIQFNSKRKHITSPADIEQSVKKVVGHRLLRAPSSEGSDSSVSANPKEKRISNTNSVADEQRLKFRERNRAAAMRCREKRKTWIIELEKRANETQRVNLQLTSEVAKLRNELVQLKTHLLAHRDCSVTKAMQQGVGITIAEPRNAVKANSITLAQMQDPAVCISQVPIAIPGTVNACASTEDHNRKFILLSKPAGLKRRRQATLSPLAGVETEIILSKDLKVEQANTACDIAVPQSVPLLSAASDIHQISNWNHPEDLKSSTASEYVASQQACVITVAPTLVSAGLPAHGIAFKSSSLTSTSYLMPTKLCLPADSTLPQIIELNSDILKSCVSETLKTNVANSSGDSMDSGHGSDVEILEIPSKSDGKS